MNHFLTLPLPETTRKRKHDRNLSHPVLQSRTSNPPPNNTPTTTPPPK